MMESLGLQNEVFRASNLFYFGNNNHPIGVLLFEPCYNYNIRVWIALRNLCKELRNASRSNQEVSDR